MSKQLHYCNKTVTSEQFQSGGTEGLQVTRADCSHRQNFERERVYVRIITDCRLVRICLLRSNLIKHLTGILVLFFFFRWKFATLYSRKDPNSFRIFCNIVSWRSRFSFNDDDFHSIFTCGIDVGHPDEARSPSLTSIRSELRMNGMKFYI